MRIFKICSLLLVPPPESQRPPSCLVSDTSPSWAWASPSSPPGPLSPSRRPASLSSLSLQIWGMVSVVSLPVDPGNGHELARAAPAGGELSQGGGDAGHTLSAQPHRQRCLPGPHPSSFSSSVQALPTSLPRTWGSELLGPHTLGPLVNLSPSLGQFPCAEECTAKTHLRN